jgi:hypothetical protein
MRRLWWITLVFILSVIAVLILYPTEEGRIRKVINRAEKAIVEEDIDALMENVSYNYADDYGNNYLLLRRRMEAVFRRLDDIEVEKVFRDISINDTEAEVMLRASVLATMGEERGYIYGGAGGHDSVRVYLEKTAHRWRIRRVELEGGFMEIQGFEGGY